MSWQDLSNLVSEIYEGFHKKAVIREQIREVAPDAAYAAWNL
jgi:hypothetical protein